ncbi:Glutarate-semialdehyde dehydrogenase [Paraburkholderia aspalathi]|uniref:NAD-dependent succinate-semialdehyde dehydrogenase n=1 Tax=Paraburkholderia aspalathi TaxID=1324617 RepID=UPI00190A1D54|nr:NAD-dependent succinate-semialdehyde dehydrogenase [Paraburkholderia aspalathi]MBK3843698.1 NAD-dependent succinate-semialdehyde dehydrogenase [Paraburkholderia aspalathi]CAE6858930.1 Glutarate-semialdehyde dehydrogenase [Paraburkholderia aspalathi]CAE6866688.1 Glutarate-semialdehyde dehydrogenase [Paraburkholderia aspalathi]
MFTLKDPDLLRMQCPIGGAWRDALDGKTIDVTDPATGAKLGTVPAMTGVETREAIAAADAALPAWRSRTAKDRGALLRKWFELVMANQEDLATLMTAEQGKPLAEARGEIAFAASFIEWFAEEARRVNGDVIQTPSNDRRLVTIRQPIGVCAAITPWNFPAAMIARKAGPALAAGCTMVIKPASQTPYSALALVVLAERAGIPAGVLSVVTGAPRPIAAELAGNPVVRKLSFTGSTEIGAQLMEQGAKNIQKQSLELGGNAPFIVFNDANLDSAVEGALISKYRNAGQTCVCSNRFYVQDRVYDAFVEKLTARVREFKSGDGRASDTQIGPLIDARALGKVRELVDDARAQGARVLCGGEPLALGADGVERHYAPTVLCDVTPGMRVAREEIFGPVAPVMRFTDEQDVISLANDTEFGLASYFYTRDIARVWRVAEALEFGMVGINTGLISTAEAPFGGVKQSGIGREGSRYGIEEYLEMKYLCMQVG